MSVYCLCVTELEPPPTMRTTTTTQSPGDWRSAKHGKHDRDSNGNAIKHSKGHKRKPTRVKTDHSHDDYDLLEGEVIVGDGLTTTSSLSSAPNGGLTKRNHKV